MFNLGLGNRDFRVFIYWKLCSGDQPSKEQGASKGGSRQLGCLPPSHLHHPTLPQSYRWEGLLAVMRMASRRGHGPLKKTRSSWSTSRSTAMEAGEHCRSLQVCDANFPFSLRKRGRSLPCENVAQRSHLFLQGSTGVARAAG